MRFAASRNARGEQLLTNAGARSDSPAGRAGRGLVGSRANSQTAPCVQHGELKTGWAQDGQVGNLPHGGVTTRPSPRPSPRGRGRSLTVQTLHGLTVSQ